MDWILFIFSLAGHGLASWQFARMFAKSSVELFWLSTAAVHSSFALIPLLMTVTGLWGPLPASGFIWLIAIAMFVVRNRMQLPECQSGFPRIRFSAASVIIAGFLIVLFAQAFFWRFATPIYRFDELMYHASKVMYWNQQGGLDYFSTHNFRQNSLSAAAEYWFLYPVLFGLGETVGRLFHSLHWCFLAGAIIAFLREWRVPWSAVLSIVLVVFLLPITIQEQANLKAEILLSWAIIGFSRSFASLFQPLTKPLGKLLLLLWFLCIAVAIKFTAILLLPVAAMAFLFCVFRRLISARSFGVLSFAGLLMAFSSGLGWTVANNLYFYHNPLGPKLMSEQLSAPLDATTIATHAARTGFLVAGWPLLPSQIAQQSVEDAGKALARISGADRLLQGESTDAWTWPGAFTYRRSFWNRDFSWFFWTAFMMAAIATIRSLRKTNGFVAMLRRLSRPSLLVCLPAFFYFAGLLASMRWQTSARLPDRFLIPVVTVLICVAIIHYLGSRPTHAKLRMFFAFAFIGSLPGFASWREIWIKTDPLRSGDLTKVESPEFAGIATALPAGSRILLIAHQGAGDYLLFNPHGPDQHTVIPWGISEFSSDRIQRLIQDYTISHVVLTDYWYAQLDPLPPLRIQPFRSWLDSNAIGPIEIDTTPGAPLVYSLDHPEGREMPSPVPLPSPEPIHNLQYTDLNDPRWGSIRQFSNGWKRSGYHGFFNDTHYPLVQHASALDEFHVIELKPKMVIYHPYFGHMQPVEDSFFVLYAFEREQWIGLFDRKLFPGDYQILPDGPFLNISPTLANP